MVVGQRPQRALLFVPPHQQRAVSAQQLAGAVHAEPGHVRRLVRASGRNRHLVEGLEDADAGFPLLVEVGGLQRRSQLGGKEGQQLLLFGREPPRLVRPQSQRSDGAVAGNQRHRDRSHHATRRRSPDAMLPRLIVGDRDREAALESEPDRSLAGRHRRLHGRSVVAVDRNQKPALGVVGEHGRRVDAEKRARVVGREPGHGPDATCAARNRELVERVESGSLEVRPKALPLFSPADGDGRR
jgi:hypothetical protein